MRSRTNLAFALGVALAAPTGGLAAQNRLPDSLSWTRLPDDPNDMPQYVMARAGKLGGDPFRAGCPADGGYGEAAYEALVLAAETDAELRGEVRILLGVRLTMWGKGARDEGNCTDDIPGFEAWLAGQLRREWEGGAMKDGNTEPTLARGLLYSLEWSANPATHALVREIARDSTLWEQHRLYAAHKMVQQRKRAGGETHFDAQQAVLFDLATAPPLPDFEWELRRSLSKARGAAFDQEYERVLRSAGRIPR